MNDKFDRYFEPEEIKPSDANSELSWRQTKRNLSLFGECHKPQSPAKLPNYSCQKCNTFNI